MTRLIKRDEPGFSMPDLKTLYLSATILKVNVTGEA